MVVFLVAWAGRSVGLIGWFEFSCGLILVGRWLVCRSFWKLFKWTRVAALGLQVFVAGLLDVSKDMERASNK